MGYSAKYGDDKWNKKNCRRDVLERHISSDIANFRRLLSYLAVGDTFIAIVWWLQGALGDVLRSLKLCCGLQPALGCCAPLPVGALRRFFASVVGRVEAVADYSSVTRRAGGTLMDNSRNQLVLRGNRQKTVFRTPRLLSS